MDHAHLHAHDHAHDHDSGVPARTPRDPASAAPAGAPPSAHAARRQAGVHAAAGFVARLAELEVDQVRAFVGEWHRAVAADADAWFAAEAAVAQAVARSGRSPEQRPLLVAVADAFTNAVWYRRAMRAAVGATPEPLVGATEASGQYAATLAMLALLVRDHLDPGAFEIMYAPFAELIPADHLADDAAP